MNLFLCIFVMICLLHLNYRDVGGTEEKLPVNTDGQGKNQVKRQLMIDFLKSPWTCDTKDTTTAVTETCRTDSIPCNNGVCIPIRWRCDGKWDCLSGEDEENCPKNCGINKFQCVSGNCINRTQQCDGKVDCATKDDELNCFSDVYKNRGVCLEVKQYETSINTTINEIQTNLETVHIDVLQLKNTSATTETTEFNQTALLLWMERIERNLNATTRDLQTKLQYILETNFTNTEWKIDLLLSETVMAVEEKLIASFNVTITSLEEEINEQLQNITFVNQI